RRRRDDLLAGLRRRAAGGRDEQRQEDHDGQQAAHERGVYREVEPWLSRSGTSRRPPTMRPMKRRSYGRDTGLTLRMLLTGGLLGLLYVIFGLVLLQFVGVGLAPMLVIVIALAFFQYYTSDKLAFAAAGAKV